MKNKVTYYVDNPEFMELLDELTTQITEMAFKQETYRERQGIGTIEISLSSEAQDFYNEKYDEFEGLLNKFNIHSDDDLNEGN